MLQQIKLIAALQKVISSTYFEIKGTDCPFTKLLITYFLNFLQERFSITVPLKIRLKKMKNEQAGDANFSKFLKGEYLITIANDLSPTDLLIYLAHEFVHVVQFVKKDLQVSGDKKSLIWKDKSLVAVDDYDKATKVEHATFPWEKEAHEMQEELVIKFQSSTQMKELKNMASRTDRSKVLTSLDNSMSFHSKLAARYLIISQNYISDFVAGVMTVAKKAKFENPENAYWMCGEFSASVAKIGKDFRIPIEL